MLRPSSCGIEPHILAVALRRPWSLGIAVLVFLALYALVHLRCSKSFLGLLHHCHLTLERHHVFIEFGYIYIRITPIEISLSVVVDKHCRVDSVPLAVIKERFAKCILEWACRRIGHCHTYCHTAR